MVDIKRVLYLPIGQPSENSRWKYDWTCEKPPGVEISAAWWWDAIDINDIIDFPIRLPHGAVLRQICVSWWQAEGWYDTNLSLMALRCNAAGQPTSFAGMEITRLLQWSWDCVEMEETINNTELSYSLRITGPDHPTGGCDCDIRTILFIYTSDDPGATPGW
jgi:hypothetical protein